MTARQHLLEAALAHHAAGRLEQADTTYRQMLAADPDDADALHLSGIIAQARGDTAGALSLIDAAIRRVPQNPLFLNNRATVRIALGDFDSAAGDLDRALALQPAFPEALRNRGDLLKARGALDEAGDQYRASLRLNPGDGLCWHKFGLVLVAQSKLDQAVEVFTQALALSPGYLPSLAGRADALHRLGRFEDAERGYQEVLTLDPDQPEILANVGTLLQSRGRLQDSIPYYRRSLAARAENPVALHNLATALKKMHALTEAIDCYRRSLQFDPDRPEVLTGLASALQAQGHLDAAIPLYHHALDQAPTLAEALNNLMFALCSHPDMTGEQLRDVTVARVEAWPDQAQSARFTNPPDPERLLRIGYVSPDLRRHPVGYFLASVLPMHDPAAFEIHCYATSDVEDETKAQLRDAVPHWHAVAGVSDEALAQQITADEIDLLVDLSGHMADHRLHLFARRAAPVQATWLGYFSTTAVHHMDYIIADAVVIPPDEDELFTEAVARLPGCYLCFGAPGIEIPTDRPLHEKSEGITFGCLNRRDKINPPLIQTWGEILNKVARSRLLLKTSSFSDETTRREILQAFADCGVDPARIILEGHSDRRHHLATYNRIDIALDTHPYGGATTTAETLWMGVPVITMRGRTFVGRVGASLLDKAGLRELIAESREDYIEKAVELARDVPRLAALRASMRARVETRLCDGRAFTRDLETLFRRLWRQYCAQSAER